MALGFPEKSIAPPPDLTSDQLMRQDDPAHPLLRAIAAVTHGQAAHGCCCVETPANGVQTIYKEKVAPD